MLRVSNKDFRKTLLVVNGLSGPKGAPGPAWAHGMIRRLGFVQVDPVSAVERAQHHILFTRNPRYRQEELDRLLERDRVLFENWTHDAAILPIESYPYWKHYFARAKDFEAHPGYRRYFSFVTPKDLKVVRSLWLRVSGSGGFLARNAANSSPGQAAFDQPAELERHGGPGKEAFLCETLGPSCNGPRADTPLTDTMATSCAPPWKDLALVRRRIKKEGALRPRDIGGRKIGGWDAKYYPKPSAAKVTMEYLWRTGELAVSRREGRQKVYDLAERVIPAEVLEQKVTRSQYVDWVCLTALERLGAGGAAQVARFFDAVSTKEAQAWCRRNLGKRLIEVEVACADGTTVGPLYAAAGITETISKLPAPPTGMKLLNPFDPLIHDRRRLLRVFGFDYALEMYVPPRKRKYGYYVLPILEGMRFTGRVDAKVDRKRGVLELLGVWWEEGVKATKPRKNRLERELHKLARFAGVERK